MILAESKTATLLSQSEQKLGDVADVVTGFYTGDNLRFIRAASKYVKGAKNYDVVDPTIVTHCTSLYGIPDIEEGYVPYIKSAARGAILGKAMSGLFVGINRQLNFIKRIKSQDSRIHLFILRPVSVFQW